MEHTTILGQLRRPVFALHSTLGSMISRVPRRLLRPFVGMLAGAFLCMGLALPIELKSEPGPVQFWVVDRDAGQVIGLDKDLFQVDVWKQRRPVWAAPAKAGTWLVTAPGGSAIGRHELLLKPPGQPAKLITGADNLGPIVDLETQSDGSALLVEFGLVGRSSRILLADVQLSEFVQHSGAVAVCGSVQKVTAGAATTTQMVVFVGDDGGRVTRYGPGGVGQAAVDLGGQIGDLAALPGGGLLVLDTASPGRLIGLDENLAVVWSVATGIAAQAMVVTPGGGQVWLADANQPLARRYGAHGALELSVDLPAADVSGGLGLADGGVLLTTPGAVIRIDAWGQIQPGQGGFNYLTDISPCY